MCLTRQRANKKNMNLLGEKDYDLVKQNEESLTTWTNARGSVRLVNVSSSPSGSLLQERTYGVDNVWLFCIPRGISGHVAVHHCLTTLLLVRSAYCICICVHVLPL